MDFCDNLHYASKEQMQNTEYREKIIWEYHQVVESCLESADDEYRIECLQILYNGIAESKPPFSLLLNLLYSENHVPSRVEISQFFKVFSTDFDQFERFYFINCLAMDNFRYVKLYSEINKENPMGLSHYFLTFVFHLTLYYIKLLTLKVPTVNTNFHGFLTNIADLIRELFKDLLLEIDENKEMTWEGALMLYFQYLLANWTMKFPTDFVGKIKTIAKKHDDFKTNRLFMVALYIPSGNTSSSKSNTAVPYFWTYFNKALKYLTGSTEIWVSSDILQKYDVTQVKCQNYGGFECNRFLFKLDPEVLAGSGLDAARAVDAAILMFIKGEGSSVNMNNKNLKNMITIKIDGIPLVKIIMKSLYSHESRNLVNENILIKYHLEADLVLYNYTMILKNWLVASQTWYKQYFNIDKDDILAKR